MPFSAVEDAIEAVGRGEIVVVVDDEDRENEGDLIMAADAVTPEKIAFFLAHTSGLICVPLTPERVEQLDLAMMVSANTEVQRTAFTVSVDYRHDTTTGISASDRSATIKALADPHTLPTDLNRPGHIFPLKYRPGGVLKRAGHTEAAIDLARAAGRFPAGVLCEVVSEDKSTMARLPELEAFSKKHGLHLISIADLIRYRRRKDKLVRRRHAVPNAMLPTMTLIFLNLGFVVGGAITIEYVFSINGLGSLTVDALKGPDIPLLQSLFLLFSGAVIVANLVADLMYGVLDPRVRT